LLVILAPIVWRLWPQSQTRQGTHTIARQKESPPPAISDDDIDSCISRQARAARLAVVVELLGTQPELRAYKAQAEQYLAQVSKGGKTPP